MLSKEKRIADTKDFKRVYQKGSFFSTSLFNLNFLPNRTNRARLGIVVSKKVASRAVDRNLLKRRFREASRKLYELLPKGYDFVISIKKKSSEADFKLILGELSETIKRVAKK